VEDEFDKTEFFEAVDWLVRKVCSHHSINSNDSNCDPQLTAFPRANHLPKK
jgi:hypothetical protein